MDPSENTPPRRHVLRLAGTASVLGLAGCGGDGDGQTDLSGPVPDAYRTAMSQDGVSRDPDSLVTKEAAQYQREPNGNQQCSNCKFYIPDTNDDDLGACTQVEGLIQPAGWCQLYQPSDENPP